MSNANFHIKLGLFSPFHVRPHHANGTVVFSAPVTAFNQFQNPRVGFNIKTIFPGIGILIIKIRKSHFIRRIPIPVRWHLYEHISHCFRWASSYVLYWVQCNIHTTECTIMSSNLTLYHLNCALLCVPMRDIFLLIDEHPVTVIKSPGDITQIQFQSLSTLGHFG